MAIGLLGKKLGMTHVYDQYGRRQAVTAVQAGPCTVVGVRTSQREGYCAVRLGFEPLKASKLTKPEAGQFKKPGLDPFRYVREFRVPTLTVPSNGDTGEAGAEWAVGQQVTVKCFEDYELVDVTGISIGKGFQGGMKRWHWKGGGKTHGSTSHRAPGSIGSTTTPGRVWRGHHLPGHMGADRVTIQNVRILRLDSANHLVLLGGSVPGAERGLVMICKSKKRPGVIKKPQEFQVIVEEDETLSKTAKAISKAPKKK